MTETIRLILESILMSILFIGLGVWLDSWLEREGFARGDKTVIIITTLCLIIVKQLWFKNLSWWLWGLGILLALVFSVHRHDLSKTLKLGKWWWKSEKKKNNIR